LKLRILIQKPLIILNKFPQNEMLKEFKKDENIEKSININKNEVTSLLNSLLELQEVK
jgi:hypothetical protein